MKALRTSTLVLACGLLAPACSEPPEANARNAILIVVDTLRADQMSLYGYGRPTTPKLDAFLSERGWVFEAAFATAPWTKPSVATILTGLDPRQHQVTLHTHALHSSLHTLGEAFSKAGFQTAAIQSNYYLMRAFGFDQGFGTYNEDHLSAYGDSHGAAVNAAALDWLDNERDASRPFFLYVHHYEPHHAYLPESGTFIDEVAGRVDAERRELLNRAKMSELVAFTSQLTADDGEFLRAKYDEEIRIQDDMLADLLAGFEARGLLEDSLVVITSDHGEEFLEHGNLSHQIQLHDELLRIPLIVLRPGKEGSSVRGGGTDAPVSTDVSLLDLGRNMLDLSGQFEQGFPGQSWSKLFSGKEDSFPIVAHVATTVGAGEGAPRELDMLRRDGFKLVRELGTGTTALFDLAQDPQEQLDCSGAEEERSRALQATLEEYLARRAKSMAPLGQEGDDVLSRQSEALREHSDELEALGYLGAE